MGTPARPSLDLKAIGWFLLLTFALTWAVESVLILKGVSLRGVPPFYSVLVVASVMFFPALSALVVSKLIARQPIVPYGWHRGPWQAYLFVLVSIPVLYALVYGLTVLLGWGSWDPSLETFRRQIQEVSGQELSLPDPALVILLTLAATVLLTPWVNSLAAFGEELGWRGFLLPRLWPLGRWRAHLLLGVIWGLWHAPLILIGFNYPGYPVAGIVVMMALTTGLGVFINEMTLYYRSVLLAAFIHGVFNSQGYSIWRLVVPDAHPLLGGITGILGIAVLGLLAWRTTRYLAQRGQPEPVSG